MGYESVNGRLASGKTVLLDGATGTELQRRGVAMEPTAWCGPSALENAGVLAEIHRDYVAAGSQVITANTFATSRMVLKATGLAHRFEEINRAAM